MKMESIRKLAPPQKSPNCFIARAETRDVSCSADTLLCWCSGAEAAVLVLIVGLDVGAGADRTGGVTGVCVGVWTGADVFSVLAFAGGRVLSPSFVGFTSNSEPSKEARRGILKVGRCKNEGAAERKRM